MIGTLTTKTSQVVQLIDFILKVRPLLHKTETVKLVLTLRGTPESGEGGLLPGGTPQASVPGSGPECPIHPPEWPGGAADGH